MNERMMHPSTPLTRDHIRAMRKADHFVLSVDRDESVLVAAIEEPHTRMELKVGFHVRGDYGKAREYNRYVSVIQNYKHTEGPFGTVLALLRPGDLLYFQIYPDGCANGYVRAARGNGSFGEPTNYDRLHADTLSVNIVRGKKTMHFLLEVQLCPDNSARSLRRD